jgi:hypothetical protein
MLQNICQILIATLVCAADALFSDMKAKKKFFHRIAV